MLRIYFDASALVKRYTTETCPRLCYLFFMDLLKTSTNFLTRIGEPFAAKTDEQGRRRAFVSGVILILAAMLYWWLYL